MVFLDSEGYADDEAPVARAAIDQCRLRVTDQSPYKAVGLAQMDAQNYCSAAVTTHEMYGVLRKFYAGQWYAVASRHKAGGIPGTTIHVSVRYDCTAPLQ